MVGDAVDGEEIRWIRHQLDCLSDTRSQFGLSVADEQRYLDLCDLERALISAE